MTTNLDSTHAAAVDNAYHWQPMTTCPKGSKVVGFAEKVEV